MRTFLKLLLGFLTSLITVFRHLQTSERLECFFPESYASAARGSTRARLYRPSTALCRLRTR